MINADDRQIPEIRTDKTALVVVPLDSHSILDMIRLLFRENGHATISFLLCAEQIGLCLLYTSDAADEL